MKLYLVLFCLLPVLGISQNLSIEELIRLQDKSYYNVKEILLGKKWIIIQEGGGKDFDFGDIRFAFDDEIGNRQNSFFISFYYYKTEPKKNKIEFEFPSYEIYLSHVAKLTQLGFEKTNTDEDVNQSWEIYQNYKLYIESVIRPVENYFGKQKTFYEWIITDKSVSYPRRRK